LATNEDLSWEDRYRVATRHGPALRHLVKVDRRILQRIMPYLLRGYSWLG
jgi:hypothetical protein